MSGPSVSIAGVPESITREAYLALIAAAGLAPENLREIRFTANGIYATVYATNADGAKMLDGNDIAMHSVYIPVVDR